MDYVELPGVDEAVKDEHTAPQIIEIEDLDIPAPDPPPLEEMETVEQAAPVESVSVAQPSEARSSTPIKTQTKEYIPSIPIP